MQVLCHGRSRIACHIHTCAQLPFSLKLPYPHLLIHTPAALDPERQRRTEFFRPAFERLVTEIRGRLLFPEKWSSWSKEEHADFRRQRCGGKGVGIKV